MYQSEQHSQDEEETTHNVSPAVGLGSSQDGIRG